MLHRPSYTLTTYAGRIRSAPCESDSGVSAPPSAGTGEADAGERMAGVASRLALVSASRALDGESR